MALKKVNNNVTICEPQKYRFWILKLNESTFIYFAPTVRMSVGVTLVEQT